MHTYLDRPCLGLRCATQCLFCAVLLFCSYILTTGAGSYRRKYIGKVIVLELKIHVYDFQNSLCKSSQTPSENNEMVCV